MSFITKALGLTGQEPTQIAPYRASDITTTTGSAIGGKKGAVTTSLSPELQNFYNLYLNEAMANMPTAQSQNFANQVGQYGQSMFGQAANLDTQGMTSDYYNRVLAGLQPQREAENVSLANTLFSQGRTGAGAGVEGGYVNPEQFALLKAREQANAGIYLNAEDRARAIRNQELQQGLGFVGLGNELRTQGYALPTSLFGTGVQLGQINNPLIASSLTGGQYVTGVNQANAAYQNQARLGDQAFLGGLFSSALGSTNLPSLGKFSNLFSSTPTGGGGMGGGGGMITSGFGTGSQNPIGYNFNSGL
jgi:hypothetical protein